MKFQVTLLAARGADEATAIRGLRAVLKMAWRRPTGLRWRFAILRLSLFWNG